MSRPLVYLLASCLVLWPACGRAGAADKPARIVSINLCTDQILYDLVAPGRIAALSYLAADEAVSAIADAAKAFTAIRGNAEEVLALEPDLVLAGSFAKPATVSLLKRLGRRVVVVPLARDLDGIRKTVRVIAAAVGERRRGEALIARFDRRLAAAAPKGRHRPSAVFYQVSSLAAGRGGLVDAVLRAAGYRNLATEMNLGAGGRLALEALVANPPDLIVIGKGSDSYRTPAADNLRHRAFRDLIRRRPLLTLAQPLLLCGTPRVAQAVEELAAARAALARANK